MGLLGGGIPTASDRPFARQYGDVLTRMTFAPGSRIVDIDDLQDEFDTWQAGLSIGDRSLASRAGFGDLSRFAAARGYDAVRVDPAKFGDGDEGIPADLANDPEWLEMVAGQYGISASELTPQDIEELGRM